ncbi:F-box protein [Thraustotheca clavata]|uniref:F-box protein n=1 Tax=Thraustotheca clavata TaxID=74557 RepID=A0A1W0A1S3_9STRA|nr:F-box protein [Thraustotheca clavata]
MDQHWFVRWNRLEIRHRSLQMRRYINVGPRTEPRLLLDDYLQEHARMQRLATHELREMREHQYHPIMMRHYPYIGAPELLTQGEQERQEEYSHRRRAVSLDVNLHKQINVIRQDTFDKFKDVKEDSYQAPPTAYKPHGNEEPLVLQKRFVLEKIGILQQMKKKLKSIPTHQHWSTNLVLNRQCIDKPAKMNGGLIALHGLEELVLAFLDAKNLLSCTMVCVRWSQLCRQDMLWEKLLVSPCEGYPLRQLLACPPSIPAIQVFMLFHTSGLANGPLFVNQEFVTDESSELYFKPTAEPLITTPSARHRDLSTLLETTCVGSVHVSRLFANRSQRAAALSCPSDVLHIHGPTCQTLKTWLSKHTPLRPDVLRSFCFQLLHGCIALDEADLVHTDMLLKHILVFTNEAQPDSMPLLRIDGHGALERKTKSYDHESAVWSLIFTAPNREENRWKNLLCSYLYCILDICLEGRLANLRQQSLMHCLVMDRQNMPRDFRSLVEYGAYLLYNNKSMENLLHHPYLAKAEWDNADWLRELHPPRDQSTYLENILSWYGTHPLTPTINVNSIPIPVSNVGPEYLTAAVCERSLLRNRFTAIQAPSYATSYWMQALASSQSSTLVRLDLSSLELSSSTILQGLSLLPHITDLKLPKAMLRESNIERFVIAFSNSLLPALETVEDAFLNAVCRMEDSYRKQLDMVEFLLRPTRAS